MICSHVPAVFAGFLTGCIGIVLNISPISAAEPKLEYNRDIRPILAENCFACHGADPAARKADLRLDVREQALAADAIVPGKPTASEMITRILLPDDDSERMPPEKSRKSLSAQQKELLRRWVAEGAEYQGHWAFLPPKLPTLPPVRNAAWVRNPVDRLILAELEKHGLTPAPEADRRTLARRLSLDLTGLPPTPEQVEAFVRDPSADYYEKYVDQLLASPHWGEHRGRYWLDAARYADTHGIHFDNYREMWSYRDWVIQAFNRNLPFDQFTIAQLAGDLLPKPTLDQRIATGFNRCNITTNEGGIIDEEYVVLYARDRTETTATVWMGLTMGCAVCHDHKYDPITQKDFYSLSAFFNNSTQAAKDGNIPNTPPIIPVPALQDREKWNTIAKQVAAAQAQLAERRKQAQPTFQTWLQSATTEDVAIHIPEGDLTFRAALDTGKGQTFTTQTAGKTATVPLTNGYAWTNAKNERTGLTIKAGDAVAFPDVGDFDAATAFTVSLWVHPGQRNLTGALLARMDSPNGHRGWDVWMQNDRIGMHLIHDWRTRDALKVVTKAPLTLRQWQHVSISYDGSRKVEGIRVYVDGQLQPVTIEASGLKGSTRTSVPLKLGQRHTGERVINASLQDVRLYSRALTALEIGQLAGHDRIADLLGKPATKRTPAETEELFAWWLVTQDAIYQQRATKLRQLEQEEVAIKSRGTIAHVWNEKPSEPMAFLLYRGEYDQRRDPVSAATPPALPAFPPDLPRNRLGLAKWLLRPEHPLTARVTVNRFWQSLFGTGIVRTSGDFGTTGELPSHPELLDWLALDFRSDWDMKRFFKLLVTSATYRQAAITTTEKREKDRDNRLLSRGPRFRMDAEMVRDYALAVSGLLVPKIGGPSVKPYQPDGVWEAVAMIGSNTRNYKRDSGSDLYRRSLYTFWKRSAPPAFLDVLNAPNRETCTVRRDRTNTPLQALLTLNDVQYIEAARVLAEKALQASPTGEGRIDFLARRVLCRPLQPEETTIVTRIAAELLADYQRQPDEAKKLITFGESKTSPTIPPAELAAWTMVVNQLLNLDEVLNK
ncbi:MAG: DUF1553 domain-containing protein [Bacteroidales bacterium]|nr:DUF1553 domain-containing protein [Bacteroidales bacterium]